MESIQQKLTKIYLNETEITPPKILNTEWVNTLKRIHPNLKTRSNDYQKWDFCRYEIESINIEDDFEIKLVISYNQNVEIENHHKLQGIYLEFTNTFLEKNIRKITEFKHHQKSRLVKLKMVELLETITDSKIEFSKKNNVIFHPWGAALIYIEKKIFYQLFINWNTN